MRARLVLIPVAVAAAFVAGCATQVPQSTQSPSVAGNGVADLPADRTDPAGPAARLVSAGRRQARQPEAA